MKKKILSLISLLALTSLASCQPSSPTSSSELSSSSSAPTSISQDSQIVQLLSSLKGKSHTVDTSYNVSVIRTDGAVSVSFTTSYTIEYMYGSEQAYSIQGQTRYSDLVDGQEANSRTSIVPYQAYFKDSETGNAIQEELTIQNVVNTSIASIYDETNGIYDPVIFDNEFKNPWDYIRVDDISKDSNGLYHLDPSKGKFIASCYQVGSSINTIEDVVINVSSTNEITGLSFVIDSLEGDGYSRTNTFSVAYTDIGNTSIKHVKAYNNSNPELESLFNKFKQAKSYTYTKEFIPVDGGSTYYDHVTGYYTQDMVFFHHFDKGHPDSMGREYGDKIYDGGQDYDYKLEKEDDGIYYAYEYNKANDLSPYAWAKVMISSSTQLTYDTFSSIGPQFYNISPALFNKNSDGSYSIVDEFSSTIGQYFDNSFIGVNSDVLSTATTKFKLTLTDEGFIVDTGFIYENQNQDLQFELKAIDSTQLPSYMQAELDNK